MVPEISIGVFGQIVLILLIIWGMVYSFLGKSTEVSTLFTAFDSIKRYSIALILIGGFLWMVAVMASNDTELLKDTMASYKDIVIAVVAFYFGKEQIRAQSA